MDGRFKKQRQLSISRSTLWGAILGGITAGIFIMITLFQLDSDENVTRSDLIIGGFAIIFPIGIVIGAFAGHLWSLVFGKR